MSERYERDTSSYDRALGFFDAVYGFALTLLVTTIDVTGVSTWDSPSAFLSTNGDQLLSFAISFVVIVVFWRQNHRLIGRFAALDGITIAANAVVMLFVVFIPFTTEAMGDPQLQALPLPTAMYALNVALAVIASVLMFQLAASRGLLAEELPWRARRAQLLDGLVTPAVFLLSIPVTYAATAAWNEPDIGKLFWLTLLVIGPVTGRWSDRVVAGTREM